ATLLPRQSDLGPVRGHRRYVSRKLTRCDTHCNVRLCVPPLPEIRAAARSGRRLPVALAALALALVLLLLPAGAGARQAGGKHRRPNILVVMTDDQAAADVSKMPNVRHLLAARGTSFTNTVD